MRVRYIALLLAFAVTLLSSGCSKTGDVGTSVSPPKSVEQIDPATAATINGVVQFTGDVPKAATIDMSADPACQGENVSEQLMVKGNRLANVFVYVKEGLSTGWTFAPQDAVVRQQGCRYVPHVIGVFAGQTVRFENADEAIHNVHPMPRNNQEWNTAQLPHGNPLMRKFQNPELMIPVKCNQHPWMKMYVNVVSNPFFAVTGSDGSFEVKGLPPGTYTLAAIHESLGEQDQQITVGPKETKAIKFTFGSEKGAAAAK